MSSQSQHRQSRVSFPKSDRSAQSGATTMGKIDPQSVISVSVIVKRRNPLNLNELGGRHLSQEEFNDKYAADPSSFDHLREFAHKSGLAVDEGASSLARRTIVMRGPVNKIEQAFDVTLNNYEHQGKRFHSYQGMISMPQEHAEPVEAVLGLDNHPAAQPHFRISDHRKKKKPAQSSSFNPPQVAQLYGFPAGVTGEGQTIGILELGGGYNSSDLSAYFTKLGVVQPKVTAVSVDGGTNSPGDPNGADGEVALDIEVAGSIAPGANIAVYFAPNTNQGFVDALTTALHDTANGPPSVISISWGSAESNYTAQTLSAFDEACQSAAALGITITVASGDNGSSDGEQSGNHVDFPASSPHVLGCGGTRLTASGTKISQEIVWNDQPQGGATGGGVSSHFALPTWQASAKVPKASAKAGGRSVPDVSGTPPLRPDTTSASMVRTKSSAAPAQSLRSGLRSSLCSTSSAAATSASSTRRSMPAPGLASTTSPPEAMAPSPLQLDGMHAPASARQTVSSWRSSSASLHPAQQNLYKGRAAPNNLPTLATDTKTPTTQRPVPLFFATRDRAPILVVI